MSLITFFVRSVWWCGENSSQLFLRCTLYSEKQDNSTLHTPRCLHPNIPKKKVDFRETKKKRLTSGGKYDIVGK